MPPLDTQGKDLLPRRENTRNGFNAVVDGKDLRDIYLEAFDHLPENGFKIPVAELQKLDLQKYQFQLYKGELKLYRLIQKAINSIVMKPMDDKAFWRKYPFPHLRVCLHTSP